MFYIWNTATGIADRVLDGHTGGVSSVIQLSDGRLCSSSDDIT
jgi:hypothetical protein